MKSHIQIQIFLILFITFLSTESNFSQTIPEFEEIVIKGDSIFDKALLGDFDYFNKNQKNQTEFDKSNLESYKIDLKNDNVRVLNLKSIVPTKQDSLYFYTMLVFNDIDYQPLKYYYITTLMFLVKNENVTIVNYWINTEEDSFFKWWRNTLGFCQSESFKTIPNKYKYQVCPPPPKYER